MAELALWTRVGATLLLVALSLFAWTWLQAAGSSAGPSGRAAAASKPKKKPKKRGKKATTGAQPSAANAAVSAEPIAIAAETKEAASESEGASDEDEGLSAAQVLARRKFKTKAIGGRAAAALAAQAQLPKYESGQQVLARFQSGSEWFPATIAEVRRGNEYNLKYDDGEVEFRVSYKLIKSLASSSVASAAATVPTEAKPPSSKGPDQQANTVADAPPSSSDEEAESDDDDGWAIVGASTNKAKRPASGAVDSPRADGDGLTKRQRESRRKKERQREIKELARAQAQSENGLHAKWGGTYSKMKYVAPPTQA